MPKTTTVRRLFIVIVEVALIALSNYCAFWLRFDGSIPGEYINLLKKTILFIVVVRALIFMPFRLYEGLWRYTSLWDLRNISAAVVLSSIVVQLTTNQFLSLGYPRSIILIDSLLLLCGMCGIRLSRRIYRELSTGQRKRGVLIYGAGDAGEMVVRDMRRNPHYEKAPLGFIDDDVRKVDHRIHGVPVLGTSANLRRIMQRNNIDEVLIAMPNAGPKKLREVLRALEPFKVQITTLPSLTEIRDGQVTVGQIRNLAFEDLLQRDPVGLDPAPVQSLIAGRRIVVTGAGGSIGSELCRQIAGMRPERLIMIERHEPSLYAIHKSMEREFGALLVPQIGDVANHSMVQALLSKHKPDIVFHAAAYKHVPLMESNPCAAVINNVRGTRVIAEESLAAGVEQFILISTDKAVNPSSIMGATKRVAELMVQGLAGSRNTHFNAVRFGNVLGSVGSVVPLFMEQIQAGGPVTVTDPEMRRYFMLIPEAVQLVLHAATIGDSGVIYVLEMGEEFKVVDLARNLIRLAGFIPDEEIAIKFIGLRPGEKLSETLVGRAEILEVAAEKIQRVRSRQTQDWKSLELAVLNLEAAAADGRTEEVVSMLQQIVPTFTPDFAASGSPNPRALSGAAGS